MLFQESSDNIFIPDECAHCHVGLVPLYLN